MLDPCPICLSAIPSEHAELPCSHRFCPQCIETAVRRSAVGSLCPLCRQPVSHYVVTGGCTNTQVLVVETGQSDTPRAETVRIPRRGSACRYVAAFVLCLYTLSMLTTVFTTPPHHCYVENALCTFEGRAPAALPDYCSWGAMPPKP